MLYIQKYTKLPYFSVVDKAKIISENEDEILIGKYKFKPKNTFSNFLKFRSKVLFVSLLIVIFTAYSMLMLNYVSDSWFKNNGIITICICIFYTFVFFVFLRNLYDNKSNKIIAYTTLVGIIYLAISSIFQYYSLAIFLGGRPTFNQIVLYNYLYVFIFNSMFYFLADIFQEDFKKRKDKKLNYFESQNGILLVQENV